VIARLIDEQASETNASSHIASAPSESLRGSTVPFLVKSKTCNKRRSMLHDMLPPNIVIPEEKLYEICKYPIDDTVPNSSCPFVYVNGDGFSNGDLAFYAKHTDNLSGFSPELRLAIELFCECYLGYDLGCAAKIPRQGADFASLGNNGAAAKWANYCVAAGIWNGDFRASDVILSSEVKQCGCYFIGQAREQINSCPGVDLGFYQSLTP
jgi:hypothetical protein